MSQNQFFNADGDVESYCINVSKHFFQNIDRVYLTMPPHIARSAAVRHKEFLQKAGQWTVSLQEIYDAMMKTAV